MQLRAIMKKYKIEVPDEFTNSDKWIAICENPGAYHKLKERKFFNMELTFRKEELKEVYKLIDIIFMKDEMNRLSLWLMENFNHDHLQNLIGKMDFLPVDFDGDDH